jgi:glucokinase
MKKYAIGTDIGGSHISCALIDIQEKQIIRKSLNSQKVNNQASAEDILRNWTNALEQTINYSDRNELLGVGFAMPGPFAYDKGVAMFTKDVAKFENLYGIHIDEKLAESLDMQPGQFRFMNDATAFAVGESWLGEAADVSRSVSITLGTGFGSAFVENEIPVLEGDNVPKMGCLWHLPFLEGIGDDYFSTRWFINSYLEKTGEKVNGVKDIAEIAAQNKTAQGIFEQFGSNLADFLAPWLSKFDAEKLIIGGNVSAAYSLFGPALQSKLELQNIKTKISISKLMEDSALVGSAHLFVDEYWQKIKPLLPKM